MNLKIAEWPVEKITPYKNNPRRNDGAVEKVAASIKEFGFRVPIIVDKDGVIIAGHTRLLAARNDEHPTMKPVALIDKFLKNSTMKNDLVFDSFGGSGSTLISCEKLGRVAYLCELEPKFVDVIVLRWEQATGKKARREGNREARGDGVR